ncbi:hypothetical protein N7509_006508 [Penicillium cosmopolitanum]|uniref:Uncharacterized protein n=1 Tax=Penicillium cosmopolitanum TaxID=1131564 RepID=A0A9W9W0E7_9EURO|nr:uncharacterized protein N7509_006508 [Penicillium cosmopolitanum]KAJ5394721.1 hypothetical protein N7509_006508 [Penicillium cosmopolitanum]
MQLCISLNILLKDNQSDDVEQDEIPTLLRFFNEGNQSDLYKSNTFIYSSGSFLTTSSGDDDFHIIIQAHTLDRHPGDEEDADIYFMHCPEAAQPTVTFLGIVLERGGQLNDGPTLLHYRLQTTVYNTSDRAHHTFPVTAYFKSGRIFGLTKESRQLAVVTDDIHFLPRPTHPLPATPSSTGKRKRVDRWSQRAGPQTPSKSVPISRTESLLTHPKLRSPEVVALDNEDEESTQITWPETTDENEPSPAAATPTPERRSRRKRKTSYADTLAQSKYDG